MFTKKYSVFVSEKGENGMKQFAKETDKFADSNIFEGIVSFRSVIWAKEQGISDRKIEKVYYDEEKIRRKVKEYSYIKAMSYKYGFDIENTTAENINKMTVGNSHGGLVALCSDRTFADIKEIEIKENGFYVMLDGIEDPYNFGYALRSLYASGVDGIILTQRNWMGAAGVVCRASAGASEQLEMYTSDGCDFIENFKRAGYKIVCSDMENSVSVYDSDLKKPIFLIVGGEKRGISRQILDMADSVVHIDYGRKFNSALSAASAASVISFEIFRQNRK